MTTSPRSLVALAEEYRAVRSATLGSGPPRSPLDHSALGLAYHSLKLRNHLAVLINRALRRPLISSFPIEVQFNNIGFCNLRCPHCPTHGTDEQHAIYQQKSFTMPRADIEKISQETMPYAQKVVTSGLGEGLLHKDVAAIVASAA